MNFQRADRLSALPPYLFVEIDRKKREAIAAGKDVIDLGVGDPDLPTPEFIVETAAKAIRDTSQHCYPLSRGLETFRERIATWFEERFSVRLDPASEVLVLVGSKEGIGHLPLAVVNPGETVLVPNPGYPVYRAGSTFAGARIEEMPLLPENGWFPSFGAISTEVRRAARLMFLNYPNNPTAATVEFGKLEQAVWFAREHHILVAQDAAYSEMFFGAAPPSILQVEGAREIAVEFHSLSKTFSMTGWRVGFAVGNAEVISALAQVKSNLDSGTFGALQVAGSAALAAPDHVQVRAQWDLYRERRDVFCEGMRRCGFELDVPQATFYVWLKCPPGFDSMKLSSTILREANVVLIPGVGFGSGGDQYVRAAMTVDVQRIREAVGRIRRIRF